MPETPEDARLAEALKEQVPNLATLYDAFANALDPFSKQRDEAERVFCNEVAGWYDRLTPSCSLHDFQKTIIMACKRHLKASKKIPTP